jgi:hypothetical protein
VAAQNRVRDRMLIKILHDWLPFAPRAALNRTIGRSRPASAKACSQNKTPRRQVYSQKREKS